MNNISFFIPAYNCESTLEESVKSIIDTNLQAGDEIIIVNDCSTDTTSELIKLLCKQYPFVRSIEHHMNKGGASARNTAIEHAKHELLFCLDSDNILAQNSVARLKDHLLSSNADVASFQELHYFQTNTTSITHKWHFELSEYTMQDSLSRIQFPGASGNYLFTKTSWQKAGGYPEFAGALDAWGFGFRQVATGSKMVVLSESHYFHRYGHDSYWVRESRKGMISLKALQIIIPFIDMLNENDVKYMLSQGHRHKWFEKMEKHPIRLKNKRSSFYSLIKKRFVK